VLTFIFFHRQLRRYSARTVWRGTVLGVYLFAGFLAQTIGLQYTTASKSAFFTGFLTILTPVIQYFFYRMKRKKSRPITRGNLFGVILATAGLYFLTSPKGSEFNRGDLLSLCCAILFACYIVYLDYVSDEPQKMQLGFLQFGFCAVGAAVAAILFENLHIVFSAEYLFALAYLTIFATVITMTIQIRYQGDTTPTRTAIIFAMEPVIAGVLAYVLRNENIGTIGILGGVFILLGLLTSELSEMSLFLRKEIIAGE
jgi:drug/metabolite transporter (DMT)-like permease